MSRNDAVGRHSKESNLLVKSWHQEIYNSARTRTTNTTTTSLSSTITVSNNNNNNNNIIIITTIIITVIDEEKKNVGFYIAVSQPTKVSILRL